MQILRVNLESWDFSSMGSACLVSATFVEDSVASKWMVPKANVSEVKQSDCLRLQS